MPGTLLLLGRLTGVLIAGPSLLANLKTLYTIYIGYLGTPLQKASRLSTVAAMATDILILVMNTEFFLDNNWAPYSASVVAVNLLKRAHSVTVVYVTVVRFRAVNRGRTSVLFRRQWPVYVYMGLYLLLSAAAVVCQLYAYVSTGWVSSLARVSDTFQVYRVLTFVLAFQYILLGVAADLQFMLFARTSAIHEAAFRQIRVFHNHLQYLCYEIVVFVGFGVSVVWGVINPLDVTAFTWVEQLVLSLMMLNGVSLIQVLSTESSLGEGNSLDLSRASSGGRSDVQNWIPASSMTVRS
ncbi:hypothetical protein DFJ73DRAFT_880151 [Zopfochytrium polystomum]|nr:hypothetical protein DFJ73DRAFT_880151 [Zopfochytrium polystomum]